MDIKGKKISILGAVRSGIGAAKLAKRNGAIPFVSDLRHEEKLAESILSMENEGIAYETGGHSDKVFDCDLIITSPGVPSDAPVLVKGKEKGIKIVSEIEFASWFCKGKIIAITGTNGKTTTTSLCAFVIEKCGEKVYTAGNIGYAFSEIADTVKENEFVVLEISSFQLDHIDRFKPKVAVLINITPDHLDRYENDYEKYKAAKIAITKNMDDEDYFVYNADDIEIPKSLGDDTIEYNFSIKRKIVNGAFSENGVLKYSEDLEIEEILPISELSLKGEHNLYNISAVVIIAKIFGLNTEKMREALRTFKAVEHRLEFVREVDGIEFINDSKATNVDAVWYALRSFDKPLHLILGGKDKGNNYDDIKEPVLQHVKKIYAIGSSADKVYNYFKDLVDTEKVDTLENCVEIARQKAAEGEIVLLSPACASFDMFNSYEHRGEVFKEAVNKLL